MKKLLLLTAMVMMLAVMATTNVMATDEEDSECPCGMDEEGECLPCDE